MIGSGFGAASSLGPGSHSSYANFHHGYRFDDHGILHAVDGKDNHWPLAGHGTDFPNHQSHDLQGACLSHAGGGN
jgi:hypothetical protein